MIPKIYQANQYEDEIYKLWEKSGFFSPDKIKSAKRYSNVLPPPNANGELHLGHACGHTIMDIFARYRRMKGERVLLLPGKDHAGILTQVVYERKLKEERGISRQDLGREKFYKESYDFCINRSVYMRAQEKKIGISADWSREKFTLDKDVLKVALETFVKMHEDGMVYRGKRIINWCPRCATALSDLEVVHDETDGKLYHIKYPLKEKGKYITVATTRPETMLGDTAVAVNPKDARYKSLIGMTVILPLMDREIPIIADDRVETEFGTGAVKVTPAHDQLDYKIGKDHGLAMIQVIDEKAAITAEGGKYAGQNTLEARASIIQDIKVLGLFEKDEDIKVNISKCERCKTTIEPLLSIQWFINVDAKKYSLKKESLKAIRSNKIKIYPDNFKKILIHWFENLEDWCVSRQIWWGPRIPAWYRGEEIYAGLRPPKGKGWTQEEDTFDTWFTSGQWAYTTLGYPDGPDYGRFYPTDMMIMGRDILPFWAARMIMLSLYRTKKIPFRNLFFTGLVLDKEGRKMSKSKGNGINPLEMIEKYGADALRLSLVMDTSPGADMRVYEEKIESYRNYATKIWNIYRFTATTFPEFKLYDKITKKDIRTLADAWIISKTQKTVREVTKFIESKNVALAQEVIKKFIWDDLADWYVEIAKFEKNEKALGYVFDKMLRLNHPFMPFVTEKIYNDANDANKEANDTNKEANDAKKKLLMMEKWPMAEKNLINQAAENEFEGIREAISQIRHIRSSYRIDPAKTITAYAKNLKDAPIYEKLARLYFAPGRPEGRTIRVTKINLDLSDLVDIEKEKVRLENEIQNLEGLINKNESLLKNPNFKKSAPAEIIAKNRSKLKEYKEKLKEQRKLLKNLGLD